MTVGIFVNLISKVRVVTRQFVFTLVLTKIIIANSKQVTLVKKGRQPR